MMTARTRWTLTAAALSATVALSPALASAQEVQQEQQPPRPVGFPPAVWGTLGVGNYGVRATQRTGVARDSVWDYSLSNGLTASARLQAPLGRQLGVTLGASASYRDRRVELNGEPEVFGDNVLTLRGEAGLLFRFKPAAPIYFAAVAVYLRHDKPPVMNPDPTAPQAGPAVMEAGGGFGVGYEFARRPGSNLSGRFEFWNFFMQPSDQGLPAGVTAKTSTRDWQISVGAAYRLRLPTRR
jgi:hypothetical protein